MHRGILNSLQICGVSLTDRVYFQKYRVSLIFVVPPLVVFLAKSPLVDEYDLSSLKELGSGAAPLSKEVEDAVNKR